MQAVPIPLSFDCLAAIQQRQALNYFSPGERNVSDPDATLVSEEIGQTKLRPRALIVDDAPDVTEMLAMFLEHAGYATVMAFSATEALETAQRDHFEVIVSDIGMPGMNGYELALALRALPEYTSVPMIAVTGFSMYDDRGRALKSGFNAHLTKPINPMALLDLIKSLRD